MNDYVNVFSVRLEKNRIMIQTQNKRYYFSTEVLIKIFAKLDVPSLLNCRLINKRWKNIADFCGEKIGLWQDMAEKNIGNKAVTFKKKSKLNWKDLYHNSFLWNNVSTARQKLIHTYKTNLLKTIHVYKDNLIIVLENKVQYYNIETFELLRDISISCLDFDETDQIIFIHTMEQDVPIITMYGKSNITNFSYGNENAKTAHENIQLYKVESNCCYVLDSKYVMYIYKWENNEWYNNTLARFYSSSIVSMHVYLGEVYVMQVNGAVYHIDKEGMSYEKVIHLDVYNNNKLLGPLSPLMFQRISVAISVPATSNFELKFHENTKSLLLKCPNLTCATSHGHILLLGYSSGEIEIRITKNMIKNVISPECQINFQKWNENLENSVVMPVALDVYEDNCEHHIFIATQCNIYQVAITYPCLF